MRKQNNEDVALGSVKAMENQILDIRPEYQREFVYKESQQQAVINTILNGFPLNSMYFVDRQDGTYEVLDGQQRILSICLFCSNELACLIPSKTNVGHFDTCNFMNLSKQNKERVLDYELDVYFCSGTEDEKLDWFTMDRTSCHCKGSSILSKKAHSFRGGMNCD